MSDVILNPERSRFELHEEGLVSVADYRMHDGVMAITHVVVPEPLRGRGSATQLGAAVVAHARQHGLKVRPVCPFMVAYFKRHVGARDVMA